MPVLVHSSKSSASRYPANWSERDYEIAVRPKRKPTRTSPFASLLLVYSECDCCFATFQSDQLLTGRSPFSFHLVLHSVPFMSSSMPANDHFSASSLEQGLAVFLQFIKCFIWTATTVLNSTSIGLSNRTRRFCMPYVFIWAKDDLSTLFNSVPHASSVCGLHLYIGPSFIYSLFFWKPIYLLLVSFFSLIGFSILFLIVAF